MEAPEKIYIQEIYLPEIDEFGFDAVWTSVPTKEESNIEYTRTDAFVEKAISWLKEQDEMIGVSFQEDFLERFKDYMKGK